jgi:hypothetical protein
MRPHGIRGRGARLQAPAVLALVGIAYLRERDALTRARRPGSSLAVYFCDVGRPLPAAELEADPRWRVPR